MADVVTMHGHKFGELPEHMQREGDRVGDSGKRMIVVNLLNIIKQPLCCSLAPTNQRVLRLAGWTGRPHPVERLCKVRRGCRAFKGLLRGGVLVFPVRLRTPPSGSLPAPLGQRWARIPSGHRPVHAAASPRVLRSPSHNHSTSYHVILYYIVLHYTMS